MQAAKMQKHAAEMLKRSGELAGTAAEMLEGGAVGEAVTQLLEQAEKPCPQCAGAAGAAHCAGDAPQALACAQGGGCSDPDRDCAVPCAGMAADRGGRGKSGCG